MLLGTLARYPILSRRNRKTPHKHPANKTALPWYAAEPKNVLSGLYSAGTASLARFLPSGSFPRGILQYGLRHFGHCFGTIFEFHS